MKQVHSFICVTARQKKAFNLVKWGKEMGVKLTAEVCPLSLCTFR